MDTVCAPAHKNYTKMRYAKYRNFDPITLNIYCLSVVGALNCGKFPL